MRPSYTVISPILNKAMIQGLTHQPKATTSVVALPCSLFQLLKKLSRNANPTRPTAMAKLALSPAMYARTMPWTWSDGKAVRICVAVDGLGS